MQVSHSAKIEDLVLYHPPTMNDIFPECRSGQGVVQNVAIPA